MLAALFPEYAVKFGASVRGTRSIRTMSRDPLIAQRNSPGERDDRMTLARWFYKGENIAKVVETLNEILERDRNVAPFEAHDKNRTAGTFETIADSIDNGLPVMLGWNTEDYGCHAVLVVGYWRGQEEWLTINDPGGSAEVSWNSLMLQQEGGGRFETGWCRDDHWGPRPMKSVTDEDGSTTIHQWSPPGA